MGAEDVYSSCTHPIFSGNATTALADTIVKEFVVTDTVPVPQGKRNGKVTCLSMAPLLGEAIRRIHGGESVGALFG